MEIRVVEPSIFHNPPIPINSSRLILYLPYGIYLLKRMSKFGVEHYGIAIHGNDLLKQLEFYDGHTRVIHKTNAGIGWDLIETFEW